MSLNKIMLIGNVGQDPKVRAFEGGRKIATVTLATTKKGYTLQNGTQVPDRTEWHNLVLSDRLADVAEKYVKKGDKLYVEGELRQRSYESKGVRMYAWDVYVQNMEMLTTKAERQQAAPAPAPQPQPQPQPQVMPQPQPQVMPQPQAMPQPQPQQQMDAGQPEVPFDPPYPPDLPY